VIFFTAVTGAAQSKNYHQEMTGLYANIASPFARQGIASVIPNYRLLGETDIQGSDDAISAVVWTKKNNRNYGGDPSRIFLTGILLARTWRLLVFLDENLSKRVEFHATRRGACFLHL